MGDNLPSPTFVCLEDPASPGLVPNAITSCEVDYAIVAGLNPKFLIRTE